jgi:hypothetical protein
LISSRWFFRACLPLILVAAGCTSQGGVGKDSRSLYVTEHPEVPQKYATAILTGEVLVGMSRDMVRAAWGDPTRMEKLAGNPKGDERWIYGNYLTSATVTHLYLKGDQLVLYELVDKQMREIQSVSDPEKKLGLTSRNPEDTQGGPKHQSP